MFILFFGQFEFSTFIFKHFTKPQFYFIVFLLIAIILCIFSKTMEPNC